MRRSASRRWFAAPICSTTRRASCCCSGCSARQAATLRTRSGPGGSQRTETEQADARHRGRCRDPSSDNLRLILALLGHDTAQRSAPAPNRPNCSSGRLHNGISREYRGAQLTPSSCASEKPLLPSRQSAWGRSLMRRVLLLDPDVARRDRLCHGLTEKRSIGHRYRRSGCARLDRPCRVSTSWSARSICRRVLRRGCATGSAVYR